MSKANLGGIKWAIAEGFLVAYYYETDDGTIKGQIFYTLEAEEHIEFYTGSHGRDTGVKIFGEYIILDDGFYSIYGIWVGDQDEMEEMGVAWKRNSEKEYWAFEKELSQVMDADL
jgi:hypothetical protein